MCAKRRSAIPSFPTRDRVRRAVNTVLARGDLDPDLRSSWLTRIGEQLEKEIVVDHRRSLDEEPFKADGGFRVLNKKFDGRLEAVLADLSEEVWRTTS